MKSGRLHPNHSLLLTLSVVLLLPLAACEEADDAQGPKIDLQQSVIDLQMQRENGRRYVVVSDANGEHRLTAEQFLEALDASQTRQRERGWLFMVLNITSWAGVLWVGLGLAGQIAFTGRMVLQWLVSEHAGRSVVPNLFWWMSLIGASMLLAYFIWRKDIVGVLGQGTGWVIYARNLWLIHRPAQRAIQAELPQALAQDQTDAPEPDAGTATGEPHAQRSMETQQ